MQAGIVDRLAQSFGRPAALLAPITAWIEAEGKTGHVASSFCFFFHLISRLLF